MNWDLHSISSRGRIKLGGKKGTLADALCGCDVFIGVSAPNLVTADMVKTMAKDAILCMGFDTELTFQKLEMVELAIEETGYSKDEAIVIGDRLYTDIACEKCLKL